MELSKQWMSVDVSGWNLLPDDCQWMAVDGSGWQWMCKCHLCVSTKLMSIIHVSDQNYLHELIEKVSILEIQGGDH